MATVFLNGRFIEQDEAKVSAFDAGMQHGVGLFETMLGGTTSLDETWVYRLDHHLDRLSTSARELGLAKNLHAQGLYDAVMETTARANHPRTRVRLTITGGDLNMLARAKKAQHAHAPAHAENAEKMNAQSGASPAHEATVMIVAQPATEYPEEMFSGGVMAKIADTRANPLNQSESHKTLNYWWRLRELQQAATAGASEAIVLQVSNHLAGGCVSNVFCVKDGALLTPIARGEEGIGQAKGEGATEFEAFGQAAQVQKRGALPSPVLPGITRGAIIELAQLRMIETRKRMISIEEVLDADEVFLTNSSWGVLPIVAVESHQIGTGAPGDVTNTLRKAWKSAIAGCA